MQGGVEDHHLIMISIAKFQIDMKNSPHSVHASGVRAKVSH